MNPRKITRGNGLLEGFLSIQRMRRAQKLIKINHKNGTILDIGCGSYPLFLINSNFIKKFGFDQGIEDIEIEHLNLKIIKHIIVSGSKIPFQKGFFDVITILAVVEHLDLRILYKVFKECYSLLKKDGILVLTTPAKWSKSLLRFLAKLHVLSREEIDEHKNAYTIKELNDILVKANFKKENIQSGYFEFLLNLWISAKK